MSEGRGRVQEVRQPSIFEFAGGEQAFLTPATAHQ